MHPVPTSPRIASGETHRSLFELPTAIRLVGLSLGLVVTACYGSSEQRAEVRSVSLAIDRLRQAANPDKAPLLSELSRVPCSLKDVCDLRDRCVGAYRMQVEALAEIDAIKAALGRVEMRSAERVDPIAQKLKQAHALAQECLENELVVGRRYGTQH